MSQLTAIEWTDLSWNPVHGCSKVSPGCAHCYAETLSRRYKQTVKPWTPSNAPENVILKPHKLGEPLSNRKEWRGLGAAAAAAGKTDGKLVFVNSTSDLFHEEVPLAYIAQVLNVIGKAQRHTFQVLTKRPERMVEIMRAYYDAIGADPFANLWLGVSIENRRFVHRADLLRETPAAARFISAEPLLGPLIYDDRLETILPSDGGIIDCWSDGHDGPELALGGIDWLIVGGESGAGHRPMRAEWVRHLRNACIVQCAGCMIAEGARAIEDGEPSEGCVDGKRTAFFFKQWGGSSSKAGGRELDGRLWSEFPAVPA